MICLYHRSTKFQKKFLSFMEMVISNRFLGAESEYDHKKTSISSRFLNIFNFSVVQMHPLTLMQQQKRACSQSLSFSFIARDRKFRTWWYCTIDILLFVHNTAIQRNLTSFGSYKRNFNVELRCASVNWESQLTLNWDAHPLIESRNFNLELWCIRQLSSNRGLLTWSSSKRTAIRRHKY